MKKLFLILFILINTNFSVYAQELKVQNFQLEKPNSSIDLSKTFHNQIKIIFTDIDGTILKFDAENKIKVPSELKKTVGNLHELNIPLVLATGRVFNESNEINKKIGNAKAYIISQQGAEIRDPDGKIINQEIIDKSDLLLIINNIEKIKKENGFNTDIVVLAANSNYSTKPVKLPFVWTKITVIKSFIDLEENAEQICIYEKDYEKLKLIQKQLKQKFPKYNINISSSCYCDISNINATKANAIKIISQKLNIDLKNAAVFGDSENDLSMIKEAKIAGGLAIAVGNSSEKLKENSNYVTDSVFNNGFSKAVDAILENNNGLK